MYLAEWIERIKANADVVTVLRSIPASSDTVDSEGSANLAVLNNVLKTRQKPPFNQYLDHDIMRSLLDRELCRVCVASMKQQHGTSIHITKTR